MQITYRSLVLVVAAALVTVLAIDWIIGRAVPPLRVEYETADGVRDLAVVDPEVLVLGSSFVRSFLPVARFYADQRPPLPVSVLPIEGGKLYAYDWLLQHRVAPFLDKHAGTPRLRQILLVSSAWDSCGAPRDYSNLPARAWQLPDYLADFVQHGATAYNGNYVDQRWAQLTRGSSLVADRGPGRILRVLRSKLMPRQQEDVAQSESQRLQNFINVQLMSDPALPACQPQDQLAALERIFAFAERHRLGLTVLHWPANPQVRTPEVIEVKRRYSDLLAQRSAAHGARFFDVVLPRPLEPQDYRADFDHLVPSGEDKVLEWARSALFADYAAGLGAAP